MFKQTNNVFHMVCNATQTEILDRIPTGNKTNKEFVISDKDEVGKQVANYLKGEEMAHLNDDKGAYSANGTGNVSKSGNYTKNKVFQLVGGNLKERTLLKFDRDSNTIIETKPDEKPVDPKFKTNNFVIRTITQVRDREEDFERKTTYFLIPTPEFKHLVNLCYVEYKGTDTDKGSSTVPMKNSLYSTAPYWKTNNAVRTELKKDLRKQVRVGECELRYLNPLDPMNSIRNKAEVDNLKANMKRKEQGISGNVGDDCMTLSKYALDKNKIFVKDCRFTKLGGKVLPQVSCWNDWQNAMIPSLCSMDTMGAVLYVDFTFNLQPENVLNTAIQHPFLICKKTRKHATVQGPTYGCPDRSNRSVDYFVYLLRYEWGDIPLITSSDEEKALIAPWAKHFPNGVHTLCCEHLEGTTKRNLAQNGVPSEIQSKICNIMYSKYNHEEDGMISARNELEFLTSKVELLSPYMNYFAGDRFEIETKKLWDGVVEPRIAEPRIPFRNTTNCLESMNHVNKEFQGYR